MVESRSNWRFSTRRLLCAPFAVLAVLWVIQPSGSFSYSVSVIAVAATVGVILLVDLRDARALWFIVSALCGAAVGYWLACSVAAEHQYRWFAKREVILWYSTIGASIGAAAGAVLIWLRDVVNVMNRSVNGRLSVAMKLFNPWVYWPPLVVVAIYLYLIAPYNYVRE